MNLFSETKTTQKSNKGFKRIDNGDIITTNNTTTTTPPPSSFLLHQ